MKRCRDVVSEEADREEIILGLLTLSAGSRRASDLRFLEGRWPAWAEAPRSSP